MVIGLQIGKRNMSVRSKRVAVAAVCLVLLGLLAFAQATHFHSDQTDADHCQLCIAVHSAAQAAPAAAAIVLVAFGASAPQAEPVIIARRWFLFLFIRPPPLSC
jgi:hypothetical protein